MPLFALTVPQMRRCYAVKSSSRACQSALSQLVQRLQKFRHGKKHSQVTIQEQPGAAIMGGKIS